MLSFDAQCVTARHSYQTTQPWKNGMLGLEHNVPQPGIKNKPKIH
jgi:hypothetical protein